LSPEKRNAVGCIPALPGIIAAPELRPYGGMVLFLLFSLLYSVYSIAEGGRLQKAMAGEQLRKRREEKGLGLREAADTLRIRPEYLRALEEDATGKFPAEVYAKGYIREYAQYLGLDPEPFLAQYYPVVPPAASEVQQLPPESARARSFALPLKAVALILFVSVLVLGLTLFRKPPRQEARLYPPPIPPAVGEETKKDAPSQQQSEPVPPTSAGSVMVMSNQTGKNPLYEVRVTATDTTWLRVEEEGGRAEEVLLRPGESRGWRSVSPLSLKVGNAGGIQISFNGKDMGSPGKKGEVVKLMLPSAEAHQNSMN
jgi:cytoskeletal protein RodZ